jgi:hypothetical protein
MGLEGTIFGSFVVGMYLLIVVSVDEGDDDLERVAVLW